MRFHPYGGNDANPGYTSPFECRAQAEAFEAHCHARGSKSARITAHSSMVMTSDNSPIVVNCRKADVESFEPSPRWPEMRKLMAEPDGIERAQIESAYGSIWL